MLTAILIALLVAFVNARSLDEHGRLYRLFGELQDIENDLTKLEEHENDFNTGLPDSKDVKFNKISAANFSESDGQDEIGSDQISAAETLSSACLGDYCDPNWTPFENMVQGLQGYNILTGNPLHNAGDPGFTLQIFVPTKMAGCQAVTLEDGITANSILNCRRHMTAKSFANIDSYRLVRHRG